MINNFPRAIQTLRTLGICSLEVRSSLVTFCSKKIEISECKTNINNKVSSLRKEGIDSITRLQISWTLKLPIRFLWPDRTIQLPLGYEQAKQYPLLFMTLTITTKQCTLDINYLPTTIKRTHLFNKFLFETFLGVRH